MPTAPWHRAKTVSLQPGATVEEAFAAIAAACRDHWQANLAAALAGTQAEGVHQVRVGLRRFRTALTLFRDYLPASQRLWLRDEAKAFADLLGPARDLDVFLTDLAAPATDAAASDPQVAATLRLARAARAEAHARVVAALTAKRYGRFMARLDAWVAGRGWRRGAGADGSASAEDFARDLLNRRLAKIRKRVKAIDRASTEELHALRIAIKKLRYGLEFFEALLPRRRSQRLGHLLKALQDGLGRLNDIDAAHRTLARLGEATGDAETRAAVVRVNERLSAGFKPLAKSVRPEAVRIAARLRTQRAL